MVAWSVFYVLVLSTKSNYGHLYTVRVGNCNEGVAIVAENLSLATKLSL